MRTKRSYVISLLAIMQCSLLAGSLGAGAARAEILVAFRGEESDQRIWVAHMLPNHHWEGPFQATGGSNTRVGIHAKNVVGTNGYILVARGIDRDSQLYWQQSMDGKNWTYRQTVGSYV